MRASLRAVAPAARLVRSCLALVAFLLLTQALLTAQAPPRRAERPAADPAASAPAWLAAGDEAQLEAFITQTMDDLHIPGLQAAIVKDGEVSWSGAFGLADPSAGVPVGDDTLFMLASISKTFTGALLLQLLDDGLVGLEDDVSLHLPFAVAHPLYPGTPITVRMLLTHTSGLADNWAVMPYSDGDPSYALEDYLRDYLTPGGPIYDPAKSFHAWEPGSGYAYCNNGLALTGLIVQHVSGTAFAERCEAELFTPLGMDASAWFLADLDPSQVARPCSWSGSGWVVHDHYGYADFPSGQLRTSAAQLSRFLALFLADGQLGGGALLQADTVQAALSQQVPGLHPAQGLVWYEGGVGGRSVWGHAGGDLGVTTEMWFDPETRLGVVVLTNGESYMPTVLDALFDHAEAWPTETSLTADVSELSLSAGGLVRFTFRGGTVHAGRPFVLLGSVSGASPGTPLPGGQAELPLVWDPITDLIVSAINTPMFANFYGVLGPGGVGRSAWDTLGPLPPALLGLSMHFAAAIKGPWSFASNPLELTFAP